MPALVEGWTPKTTRLRIDESSGVITKEPLQVPADPRVLAKFRNEYEITHELQVEGLRKAIEVELEQVPPYIKLRYVLGTPLSEVIANGALKLRNALEISIGIAEMLEQIHEHRIIYKNLSPSHIIIGNDGRIKLIDFSIATHFDVKQGHQQDVHQIEGNLPYISPEQTGRMNRVVDYRTDFYSLGVIMYEMLLGELPFESTEALNIVHSHIARIPESMSERDESVPFMVDAIVMKLLAKAPEDRYRSTQGILHDLRRCLEEYEINGTIRTFELSMMDRAARLELSDRMYGRQKEIERLRARFKAVVGGESGILLISGEAGVGKTSLIGELLSDVSLSHGYFINGKFDEFGSTTPSSPLFAAFRNFIKQILSEDEEQLAYWKDRILDAVGDNGRILMDLIPELVYIIGEQPELQDIGVMESQNRSVFVFLSFVKALGSPAHPLVLFIDDLQWVDVSTTYLLESVLTSSEINNILIIGAYRDDEVDKDHLLTQTIESLRSKGANLSEVSIGPLGIQHVEEFISDALTVSEEEARSLAALIHEKTNGNPFFLHEFMRTLYRNGLLTFNRNKLCWQWDDEAVRLSEITDNVLELIKARLQELPQKGMEVLKIAAIIGTRFEMGQLHSLSGLKRMELIELIEDAVARKVLIPSDYNFKHLWSQDDYDGKITMAFPHDRLREAVYESFPESALQDIHWRIGKYLLESGNDKLDSERVFDAVTHLNLAPDKAVNRNDRLELAELNYNAGKQAWANSAFQSAWNFYRKAIDLLDEKTWEDHWQLAFNIYEQSCHTAYCISEYNLSAEYAKLLLEKARSPLDTPEIIQTLIRIFESQEQIQKSAETAIAGLKDLGVVLPLKPSQLTVARKLIYYRFALPVRRMARLQDAPDMTDPGTRAAMKILYRGSPGVYRSSPELFVLMVLKMIELTIKHGVAPESPFAFSIYHLLIRGAFKDYKGSVEISKFALGLLERVHEKQFHGPLIQSFFTNTQPLIDHIDTTLKAFEQGYLVSRQSGEIYWAAGNLMVHGTHSIIAGRPLAPLTIELQRNAVKIAEFDQPFFAKWHGMFRQWVRNMHGVKDDPSSLIGKYFSEEDLKFFISSEDNTVLHSFYTVQAVLCYNLGEFEKGVENAERAHTFIQNATGQYLLHTYYIYAALLLLADSGTKKLRVVRRYRKQIKQWATMCPANFKHALHLVDAEIARRTNKRGEALLLYRMAAEEARNNGFLHEEALVYEKSGEYLLELGLKDSAVEALSNAYLTYSTHGFNAKLDYLDDKYGELIPNKVRISSGRTGLSGKQDALVEGDLDLQSVLKASNAIGREVMLGDLLARLMDIAIESAGAEMGLFITSDDSDFKIIAEKNTDPSRESHELPLSLLAASKAARSVVLYSARSFNWVLIRNAQLDSTYRTDPHVQRNNVLSILCIPIVNQGELLGLLYLENNLVADAFTSKSINLLQALSGQIAISLSNALLYEDLENKVVERTREIEEERRRSDELLFNILPQSAAEELKAYGRSKARQFDNVSVLFTDFVGFTRMAESLAPGVLVEFLDKCFGEFDRIMSKYDVEKIKTIGDSYMAAGGVPESHPLSTVKTVLAAIELHETMDKINKTYELQQHQEKLQMRIGIHTGSIVAGVIGNKRIAFDLWGDTVNIASRCESSADPGTISITRETYLRVQDFFECEPRGKISVKNKAPLDMYYVVKAKPGTVKLVRQ